MLLSWIGLLPLQVLIAAQERDQRAPLPADPDQIRAERLIRELYQSDFAKKTPYSMGIFSGKLLAQAKETRDDTALRYVFYREAAELGTQIGNPTLALGALRAMGKDFKFDLTAATYALLAKITPQVSKLEGYRDLCEAYLRLVDEYLESDQFGQANRAIQAALASAGKANDPSLESYAQAVSNKVSARALRFEKAEQAEKTLATQPADPAANRVLGEYLCLDKRSWEKGLPYLTKDPDSAMGTLAAREHSPVTDAKGQLELGDGWWSLAEKESDPGRKSELYTRARFWYESARRGLDGPAAQRILARLVELDQRNEPSPTGLVGRWSFEEGDGARVQDSSGRQNGGTLENGARRSEGYVGKGVSFDGRESYLALGAASMPAPESPQTIFWAHRSGSIPRRPESIVVLSNVATQTNLTAGLREDKVVVWKWGGVPLVSTPSASVDEWHLYTYWFDGTTHKLFVDGFLKDESTIPSQKGAYSKLEIGRWLGHDTRGPGSFFKGSVDEVRVYSRALSDEEIRLVARR
jgi:hypothetical protein